jgi:hypothetical protein
MAKKLKYSARFKRNYVAFFAIVFFFAILISELLLALSIPVFVNREDAYAKEIKKREMLLLFDETQRTCRAIPEKNENVKLEKMLLSDTMDILAAYLREESDRLTAEDVDKLAPQVEKLHRIAKQLESGAAFSSENKLDSTAYIKSIIEKNR